MLSNCPIEDLPNIAERTRIAIAGKPIPTSAGEINVTASLGAVVAANEIPVLDLLAVAERALYEAKRSGRNRVRVASCEARRGREAVLVSDRESSVSSMTAEGGTLNGNRPRLGIAERHAVLRHLLLSIAFVLMFLLLNRLRSHRNSLTFLVLWSGIRQRVCFWPSCWESAHGMRF